MRRQHKIPENSVSATRKFRLSPATSRLLELGDPGLSCFIFVMRHWAEWSDPVSLETSMVLWPFPHVINHKLYAASSRPLLGLHKLKCVVLWIWESPWSLWQVTIFNFAEERILFAHTARLCAGRSEIHFNKIWPPPIVCISMKSHVIVSLSFSVRI